jgi:hypothetical protein
VKSKRRDRKPPHHFPHQKFRACEILSISVVHRLFQNNATQGQTLQSTGPKADPDKRSEALMQAITFPEEDRRDAFVARVTRPVRSRQSAPVATLLAGTGAFNRQSRYIVARRLARMGAAAGPWRIGDQHGVQARSGASGERDNLPRKNHQRDPLYKKINFRPA